MSEEKYVTREEWKEIYLAAIIIVIFSILAAIFLHLSIDLPQTAAELSVLEIFGSIAITSIWVTSICTAFYYGVKIYKILAGLK